MAKPTFRQALLFWLKLGLISFGGPAAQIAIMHRELVTAKRWIDEHHFLHSLNLCVLLPGPEAQQLATLLGWRLHGTKGAIAAGTLFILPAALLILALSYLSIAGHPPPPLTAALQALTGAALAILIDAIIRIGSRSLRSPALIAIATTSFIAVFLLHTHFITVIAAAGLTGLAGHRLLPRLFPTPTPTPPPASPPPPTPRPWRRTAIVLATTLALWWSPILAAHIILGPHSTPATMGLFFSKTALVSFGGAYTILPYVTTHAVETHQWLDPNLMLQGLALAETTPGPLVIILQFVGFAGGWHHPAPLNPLPSALLCSAITTWSTFLPGFLLVLLAAPWMERLTSLPALSTALAAITAAVTGLLLHLATTLAASTLHPEHHDPFTSLTTLACLLTLRTTRIPVALVVPAAAIAGIIKHFCTS